MNVERIIALQHRIASLPRERFDMGSFGYRHGDEAYGSILSIELDTDCGTAGCIAGWACAMWAPDRYPSPSRAQDLLGLTNAQAEELFYAWKYRRSDDGTPLSDIPPHLAAQTLGRLAETGRVRWS